MSRSRSLNRFNRFTAKSRRRVLRADLPDLREHSQISSQPFDHADQLRQQALDKEVFVDLLETDFRALND